MTKNSADVGAREFTLKFNKHYIHWHVITQPMTPTVDGYETRVIEISAITNLLLERDVWKQLAGEMRKNMEIHAGNIHFPQKAQEAIVCFDEAVKKMDGK